METVEMINAYDPQFWPAAFALVLGSAVALRILVGGKPGDFGRAFFAVTAWIVIVGGIANMAGIK